MNIPSYFVDEVTEPVRLISPATQQSPDENGGPRLHRFSTLEQIRTHFSSNWSSSHATYLISICQRHSWGPLQITKPMLGFLVKSFHLNSSVWELASCFYARDSDLESTFCIPFAVLRDGPITEVSYTIRYPEFKSASGQWIIRQTGVYQKFNTETQQSLFVLFSPTPVSKIQQKAEDWALTRHKDISKDYFWLHKELFDTYLPAWRPYNAYLEGALMPMADNAVVTFIEELSDTESRHLPDLAFLEYRFLQIPVILAASRQVLEGLSSLCRDPFYGADLCMIESAQASSFQFERHRRNCEAYTGAAEYLQRRAQSVTRLLACNLSFREQLNTKGQNDSMLRLNKSAVFITTLTLLYLPPSFVATFFGMNFFDLDYEGDRIVGTSMIWVYVLCSGALTAGTFVMYRLLLDGTLSSHLRGKIRMLERLGLVRGTERSLDAELGIL